MNSLKDAIVCVNGIFTPPEEARVSIFDRGFLYGDSIYEVTLTYDGIPFLLDEHFDRLEHSAAGIFLELEANRDQIKRSIYEGIKRVDNNRIYIRIIVTRGGGEIGLDPNLSDGQNLFIIFRKLTNYPVEWYEKGVSLIITEVVRNAKNAVDPNVKSGNYLNNVMAISQAKKKGAYDAIMLNADGFITECTSANVWMVQDQTFYTPPIEAGLLGGITRKSLLNIGKAHGLSMEEKQLKPEDLCSASEIFMTSSTREILPVTNLDGQPVGNGQPGPETQRIHALYKEFVRVEVEKEKKKAQSAGLLT
jgi:branched-chain amino acid aminotransferase